MTTEPLLVGTEFADLKPGVQILAVPPNLEGNQPTDVRLAS